MDVMWTLYNNRHSDCYSPLTINSPKVKFALHFIARSNIYNTPLLYDRYMGKVEVNVCIKFRGILLKT